MRGTSDRNGGHVWEPARMTVGIGDVATNACKLVGTAGASSESQSTRPSGTSGVICPATNGQLRTMLCLK
eukprot:m.58673 g.58673  ORF g.58673 m.58673 type:complete len:70 (+) comp12892_c0_seq1:477-686(+)